MPTDTATKAAIPCLTPQPADMLRYDADRGCVVDPCEDGWPVVAIWSEGGRWVDVAGFAIGECDAEFFDGLRAAGRAS